jgi:hypothetical protein
LELERESGGKTWAKCATLVGVVQTLRTPAPRPARAERLDVDVFVDVDEASGLYGVTVDRLPATDVVDALEGAIEALRFALRIASEARVTRGPSVLEAALAAAEHGSCADPGSVTLH